MPDVGPWRLLATRYSRPKHAPQLAVHRLRCDALRIRVASWSLLGGAPRRKWVSPPLGSTRPVSESLPMLEAIDRWENEGGAFRRNHRPDPLPADSGWTAAATARGRMASRAPTAGLAPASADHGRRSYLRGAPELDGVSGGLNGVSEERDCRPGPRTTDAAQAEERHGPSLRGQLAEAADHSPELTPSTRPMADSDRLRSVAVGVPEKHGCWRVAFGLSRRARSGAHAVVEGHLVHPVSRTPRPRGRREQSSPG
jgi:hypothetical protein